MQEQELEWRESFQAPCWYCFFFMLILVLFRSTWRGLDMCLVAHRTGCTIAFACLGEWPVKWSKFLNMGSSGLRFGEIFLAPFIEKDSHLVSGHNFLKFLGFTCLISKIWQWNGCFSLVAWKITIKHFVEKDCCWWVNGQVWPSRK